MNNFEVEVVFKVVASDEDDAVRRVRDLLDPVSYTFQSGIRGYFTYDDCAHETEKETS